MSHLPIVHMTLYKHGVGYFRRRGKISGEAIQLSFRRETMDDLLKSLTVIDYGRGQVQGVDYETPQSQAERLAGCSVILDDRRSLRDLLMALRGRTVQLFIKEKESEIGLLVGLDEAAQDPLQKSIVSLLREKSETVATLPLDRIEGVELRDETAAGDLRFFLQTALGQESHRSITIRLSPGEHDLEISYIAPAPTWRVSYRLVADDPEADDPEALLQGWGIFDNQLEEDLRDISLSLTAGMPISFIYDLYTPHTPTRPVVEEEDRTAAAPVMFEQAAEAEQAKMAKSSRGMGAGMSMADAFAAPAPAPTTAKMMAGTVESAATGEAMGELFQYKVSAPVSVGRGKSAMVPIISDKMSFKKELIYNGQKMAVHPVATIRFDNETGLTLERGPVTVLENGEYVGEAILPFTVDQSEAVISYAVELSLHVTEDRQFETQLHALNVHKGYLIQQEYNIRRTIYRLDNRTATAKTVLLEHPIAGQLIPFDMVEPEETTLNHRRYKVEAAPGKITEFTVQERRLNRKHEKLQDLSYKNLQTYLKDKFLDKRTYQQLKALLDIWAEIEGLRKEIAKQEKQRAKIYQNQEQIQKNMKVLSNDGEEGKLRTRYVQQLTQSEEELARIEKTIAARQTEIEQKETQVQQMIAALG